jgi:hypothetical protein
MLKVWNSCKFRVPMRGTKNSTRGILRRIPLIHVSHNVPPTIKVTLQTKLLPKEESFGLSS